MSAGLWPRVQSLAVGEVRLYARERDQEGYMWRAPVRNVRWCTALGLGLVIGVAACTPRPGPPDPFAGVASSKREGVRQYRVRFEVACDHCSISYMVGPSATSAKGRQVWSRNVTMTPLQRTALRLTATPEEDGRPIRYLRISVDGDVVAEQGCGNCRDGTVEVLDRSYTTMSVEAIIPRG